LAFLECGGQPPSFSGVDATGSSDQGAEKSLQRRYGGSQMARVIGEPKHIRAHGEPPKVIEEFIGRLNSGTSAVSIARMVSPAGWGEPGQTPEFDEYTVVLRGALRVETRDAVHELAAGQAIAVQAGEWVRYSTPHAPGAEYIAVCIPAFAPETVHRDS
jgi:quercetin dioxygenase-like cupin family protein